MTNCNCPHEHCDKPILMSSENPHGYKLEDLLQQLVLELGAKNSKIIGDGSDLAKAIVVNNNTIANLLVQAEHTQRDSGELLAAKSPDEGPTGTPRIGENHE